MYSEHVILQMDFLSKRLVTDVTFKSFQRTTLLFDVFQKATSIFVASTTPTRTHEYPFITIFPQSSTYNKNINSLLRWVFLGIWPEVTEAHERS